MPSSRRSPAELEDLVDLLVATELASSKGDARRTLDGQGYRANGVPIDATSGLAAVDLLHGRYLLLRRGKKSHHLIEVFS